MSNQEEWLRKRAAEEDGCIVSVGGLVTEMARLEALAAEIEKNAPEIEHDDAALKTSLAKYRAALEHIAESGDDLNWLARQALEEK